MQNPFEVLNTRLGTIESLLLDIKHGQDFTPAPSDREQFIDTKEAAKVLGIAEQTIYINIKRIPHHKKHGRLYFLESELLQYIAEEGKKK
jgi:predicted DNA-binding transcriptional regulator AlpA